MNALNQIESAAKGIIEICQKKRTDKADKEKLLRLQGEIFTGIENLMECELCGAITDLIVTMTVNEVTAKLCKACGIHALEIGKIEKPKPRKQSTRSRSKKTSRVETPEPEAAAKPEAAKTAPEKQIDITEVYAEVEKQTNLKRVDIKKLHKIIQEIAGPMNLEHTIMYVKNEAELAKLKIEEQALTRAVELLFAA
jgi:hypothetical protein